ncbi:unnamed protein product [Ambrosiozyma monospora]|uniref:Unnamed protein product n=1 Tax=Ambrosiozyma monospora TaxID=43982 RepID=A0ACB5TA28_AMBMO|nr:unnamed protein product [Ambrosiozyma monospora]
MEIDVKEVFDLQFSPRGTFLTTWSRPEKLADESGNWADNVRIFKLDFKNKSYGLFDSYLNKAQSGWRPQYTIDESMICKMSNPYQLDFFSTHGGSKLGRPLSQLKTKEFGKIQSFKMSPGKNPSIAVFIPAQKGNQAYIKVYSLSNVKTPTSQKQFFKGESCEFTWNSLGTSILALVSTDVDSTNQSYYGETSLYLLGINGAFDQKITLDKEGPIHDITWSPTSREFAVIYGYMPSQTTFFDARGNSIHSLPPDSRNTIKYSPHGKFILSAGFGNLQGKVDILDRQAKFKKIASFEAPNTSVCKWAPDGRYILTATTSPRLRVDNGVKIWYFDGTLVYVKDFTEMYGVGWRSQPLEDFPPIGLAKEQCVAPHISAVEFLAKKMKLATANADKPAGAYRPPHARRNVAGGNGATLTLAQREAQQLRQGKVIPGFSAKKVIPGAVPMGASGSTDSQSKNKKRRQRNKKKAQGENGAASDDDGSSVRSGSAAPKPLKS